MVTTDFNNASPTAGIYGIYNRFLMQATTDETSKFNTYYVVRVTILETSDSFEFNFDPNNQTDKIGWINPVNSLKERYFKSSFESTLSESVTATAYSNIQIEVGEAYSELEDESPVFKGYDTSDIFYFYNGFEPIDNSFNEVNFRDANWYDTTPIKLPVVKTTKKVIENDVCVLSAPSEILGSFAGFDVYELKNIVWNSYTVDGIPVNTATVDLSVRPGLMGNLGYWNYNVTTQMYNTPGQWFNNPTEEYIEVHFEYEPSEGGSLVDSEIVRFYRDECNPKYDRFRLRWTNRYSADEYQSFKLRSSKSITISNGKNVSSDGIDYNSSNFADVINLNNPQLTEFGKTVDTFYALNTDYLTQEEIDALVDLFRSPSVIAYDQNNNAIPVIVKDRNYKIVNIKNELKQVSITLQDANTEPIQIQ